MPTLVNGGGNPQRQANQNENEHIQSNPETDQKSITANDVQVQNNQIATPTIINNTVPIVVFVGPPASGKSMILVRLAKYLRDQGYEIQTDPTFLNTTDYQNGCSEFQGKLNTNIALDGSVKFLLVKVYKDGREIAKLLEAPGEDFYTTDIEKSRLGKNDRIETYLSAIMTSSNPKSYVVLLDLDSKVSFRNDTVHRNSYSQRFLKYFYPNIDEKRDRIILLYNKIDTTHFGNINRCTDIRGAESDARMCYPQLFASIRIRKFGGLISLNNYVFKTFCTGMFTSATDDYGKEYQTYNAGNDIYPRELWKEITRRW